MSSPPWQFRHYKRGAVSRRLADAGRTRCAQCGQSYSVGAGYVWLSSKVLIAVGYIKQDTLVVEARRHQVEQMNLDNGRFIGQHRSKRYLITCNWLIWLRQMMFIYIYLLYLFRSWIEIIVFIHFFSPTDCLFIIGFISKWVERWLMILYFIITAYSLWVLFLYGWKCGLWCFTACNFFVYLHYLLPVARILSVMYKYFCHSKFILWKLDGHLPVYFSRTGRHWLHTYSWARRRAAADSH